MSLENRKLTITGKCAEKDAYIGTYNTDDDSLVVIARDILGNLVRGLAEAQDYTKKLEAKLESAIFVKGTYYYKCQPMQGYFETGKVNTIVCGVKEIEELLELRKQIEELKKKEASIAVIVQAMKKKSEGATAEELTEKEASERYGQNIIAKYKQENRLALLKELLPDINRLDSNDIIVKQHKQEIIDKYKATHADEFLSDERIEQIKAEAVEEYKKLHPDEDIFTKGRRERGEVSAQATAYFLNQLLNGVEPKNINRIYRDKEYTLRAVYRLIQVHDLKDKERIISVYKNHTSEFVDISMDDLEQWLDKKLGVDLAVTDSVVAVKDSPAEVDDWGEPIVKEAE